MTYKVKRIDMRYVPAQGWCLRILFVSKSGLLHRDSGQYHFTFLNYRYERDIYTRILPYLLTPGFGQYSWVGPAWTPPPPPVLCSKWGHFNFSGRHACKVYVPPLQSSGLEGSSWPDPAVSFYIYTVTYKVIILEMRILLAYTGFLAAPAIAKTKPK